jgi:hypothetical protein
MLRRLSLFVAISLSFAAAAVAQPVVSFTASASSAQERDKVAIVHVQRTGDLNAAVTCSINVNNLANGSSFSLPTVVFAKGESDHPVTLVSNLDNKYYDNPPRIYRATITSVSGGSVGTPSVIDVDIIDDESKPIVSVADVIIGEGNPGQTPSFATFTIRTTQPFPTSRNILFSIHDGTAKQGSDYQWFPGTGVTSTFLPADAGFVNVTVAILPDRAPEGDETFFLQLEPGGSEYTVNDPTGTCTITDDDGAVTPLAQRFARGTKGMIHISVGDPATSPETVQLLAIEPFLSVPPSVTIPAGGNSADVEIAATGTGQGTVFVTLPPQRGGRVYNCAVTVFEAVTVSFDPLVLNVPVGASATVKVKLDPPPSAPAALKLTQTAASVADVPGSASVDISGNAAIPVHALAVGSTTVSLTLPDPLGEVSGKPTSDFVVVASLPSGLVITSLSQKTGRTSGGETVKVFGTNFNSGPCAVTFGGVPAQSNDAPANGGMNVVTPPHDAGIVDVGIRCGKDSFTSAGAFTFTASPLTATELSPATGSARGGTVVVVRGTNLRAGLCFARFGNATAHTLAWNGSASITVSAPPHTPGTVPVTLSCGGESATITPGFNYTDGDDAAPSIATAVPVRAAPGDRITISGARFRADDVILFDTAVAGDAAAVTTGVHLVTVPELPPGTITVSLRDITGRVTTGPKIEITAPPAPTITTIAARLTIGAEFAVTGTGFRRSLTFGLGPAIVDPLSINPTRAVFRVPSSLAAGPASFTISQGGTTLVSRPVDLTSSGLAVASISPPCSVREGGTLATLSGNGFDEGAMVQFGTTYAAGVTFRDRFTLGVTIPPAFAGGDTTITVVNPDGTTATLTNGFAYKSASEGGCSSRRRGAGR